MLEKLAMRIKSSLHTIFIQLHYLRPYQPVQMVAPPPAGHIDLLWSCFEEHFNEQGFSIGIAGCGRDQTADPDDIAIFHFTSYPRLDCVQYRCHDCNSVLYRFQAYPEELARLRQLGVRTVSLTNDIPIVIRQSFYQISGQWPYPEAQSAPDELTVEDLPDNMKLRTAEG